MSMRAFLIAALLGLGLAAAFAFWPKRESSPQEIVQQHAISMARAAEKRDLGRVMEHVSERFVGARGNLSKQELRSFLAAQILRGTWVKVFIRDMEVELLSETRARFRGRFVFGRSEADTLEGLAKDSAIQAYEVEAEAEREEDGEWRFITGRYRVLPPGQLL